MKFLALCVVVCCAAVPAYGSLIVPADELGTYVDANGIYTIVGNIQNQYGHAVAPVLTVHVQDHTTHTYTVLYGTIPAGLELPFKIKMPGVADGAALLAPKIHAARAWTGLPDVSVMYDSLVIHDDGHLTGYAVNEGNHTIHDPVVWAVVVGVDGPLDVARNAEPLGTMLPGQVVQFEMYPDPAITDTITYYSCFAPSDNSVFPIRAQRNGQAYDLRYESGAWLYLPVFSKDGSEVSIRSTNSFPFETFANIEIPPVTRDETFTVYLDGQHTESTQSIDEMGMWHLVFDIPKHSQHVITIRGFADGDILPPLVPTYLRDYTAGWAAGTTPDDTLLESLRLLADRSILPAGIEGDPLLPVWLAPLMGWHGEGNISDDQFLAAISYMVQHGVIRLG